MAGAGDGFLAGLSADAAINVLVAQPSGFALTARLGDPAPQPISAALRATGTALAWTATTDVPWLRLAAASGTTPGRVDLAVEPGALPAGTHTGNLILHSASGPLSVPVSLAVGDPPSVASVAPAAIPAGSAETVVTLTGRGFTASSAVEINGTRVPASAPDTTTLRFTLPADMLRAAAAFEVVVVNPDMRSAPVRLVVTSDGPIVTTVAHAATWRSGPVAPGQIVMIGGTNFGPDQLVSSGVQENRLPTTVASVSVYFDSTAAPVLWASKGQVAALVPWSVANQTVTSVSVETRGIRSIPVRVSLQAAAPGLFTAAGSGQGQVAALNQEGTLNWSASPAERGSVLVLFGTGEGLVSPALPSGTVAGTEPLPRPVLPVAVRIGGLDAAIEYAGSVPGSPTGLFQVNVRVPALAPAGDAVALSLSVGPHTSPAGTTVAIR
jgi:uncharacterized protein (TIGR03437 family)